MVQSQYSLTWDAYKSNICSGFSALQQNGEFVDMTLAADGHFVKVHQVLMALVSPYLKDLITSAPCQHPVIFLNNVSHKTLSCLLEYVYTGEVLVPSENLMSFVETAKALHINGLEDFNNKVNTAYKVADNSLSSLADSTYHMSGTKRLTIPDSASTQSKQISLPAAARKIIIKQQESSPSHQPKQELSMVSQESNDNLDYSDAMDTSAPVHDDSDDDINSSMPISQSQNSNTNSNTAPTNLQFTVSIRGSLQVILNRYIYNLHSSTHRTGIRRWRCVDYRNNRCKAFVVTKGNVVLNRANLHNHSFHDKKILQKIEKKAVFSALDDIKEYKQKEVMRDKEMGLLQESGDYELSFAPNDEEDVKDSWKQQTSDRFLLKM